MARNKLKKQFLFIFCNLDLLQLTKLALDKSGDRININIFVSLNKSFKGKTLHLWILNLNEVFKFDSFIKMFLESEIRFFMRKSTFLVFFY